MEYVCTGATLKSTMGTSCPKLKATPKNVSLTGKDQANIADYVSIKNIPSFGRCRSLGYPPTASATAANHGKLTPMPCVPGTCPKWKAIDKDSLICGEPALLKPATLKCMYGGTISIVDPGQRLEIKANIPIINKYQNDDIADENLENEVGEEKKLTFSDVLDGIQLTLDLAGFAPGIGAIPDLANAAIYALRGNWLDAGLSVIAAVPLVGDAAAGIKVARKGMACATRTKKIQAFKSAIKNNDIGYFVDKSISRRQLMKNGMSAEEADTFLKGIRTSRKKAARDFIKKHNPDMDMKSVYSHVNCIETANPVIIKKIPPPNNYIRYECPDGGFGEYITYSTNPPPSAESLGILSYQTNGGVTIQKVLREYSVSSTEQFEVMQSTARKTKAPKDGNWNNKSEENLVDVVGGGTQIYTPFYNKDRFIRQ